MGVNLFEIVPTWIFAPMIVIYCINRALQYREDKWRQGSTVMIAVALYVGLAAVIRVGTDGGRRLISDPDTPGVIQFLGSDVGYFIRLGILFVAAVVSFWWDEAKFFWRKRPRKWFNKNKKGHGND